MESFGRFDSFITRYPYFILIFISILCTFTTYFSITSKKLPSFEDPQLGFEARGTEISKRVVAWDKLLEESRHTSGSLVINPSDVIKSKKASSPLQLKNKDEINLMIEEQERNGRQKREDSNPEEKPDDGQEEADENKGEDHISSGIEDQLSEELTPDEQWKQIYRQSNINLFCDEVQSGYSQIIFSAKGTGNLFTLEAVQELCNFQKITESIPQYMRGCITANSGNCCNVWSLPNYIASISKLPDCKFITQAEVNSTLAVLEYCLQFYSEGKLSPLYFSKNDVSIPKVCSHNNNIYSMMQYVVDRDFLSSKAGNAYLKDTSLYLPLAKSSGSSKMYHDIENIKFASNIMEITAMDLGVKYSLFDEYLIQDIRYLALSTVFIVFCVWMYTGCGFITLLTITAIFFSLVNAYFIYTFILGLKFFPFMNILAVIVSLGIGSDDAYIICKVWQRTEEENSHLSKVELVYLVVRHSAVAVFVTTLTTVAAFLSSYWSSVTAIRCFSIFAGLSTLLNFIFMITWILSGIIISSEWPRLPVLHWNMTLAKTKNQVNRVYDNVELVKSSFDRIIIFCIEKYNLPLIIFFGSLSAISIFIVLCWPRLQVPDSTEFQLFDKNHPFEKYEMVYKHRFRFSHSYQDQDFQPELPLRFVWGVIATDTGNYLDPNNKGSLQLDSTFDLSAPESQEWLVKFCNRLRGQPFYKPTFGPALSNCFIETFKKWMARKCIDPVDNSNLFPCCENSTFPYSKKIFNTCVVHAMSSLYSVDTFLTSEVAGPRFMKHSPKRTPKIKAAVVEFMSNMSYTSSFETMGLFYQEVESWMKNELESAPPGMKNGWFITYLSFYDLQRTLLQDTTVSILISMTVALCVLFGATFNIPLSLIAILTITCIIFTSVSVLVLLGWKLNILESIAISLAIGMSVDFSLHYAVNYKLSIDKCDCQKSVVQALCMMAAPSIMAAVTTGASGLFMLPSVVLPYIQIGIFLIVVSCVSWIYATFFQMSILYRFGPQNHFGEIKPPSLNKLLQGVRSQNRPTRSELDLFDN